VVDDDLATRLRVREVLQVDDDFKLAGDIPNADEALNNVSRLQPNLVVLGIRVPGLKAIRHIRQFKRILIGLRIIVVTGTADGEIIESWIKAGAESCLIKPLSAGQCLATLKFARDRQMGADPRRPQPNLDLSEGTTRGSSLPLSQREREVLEGLAEGLLYKEIALKLGISHSAVHKHQHRLFKRLHVSNRSEAIQTWFQTPPQKSSGMSARIPRDGNGVDSSIG